MKRWRGVFLICCAGAWPVMAEPVAGPAESWEVYDLIAKARIRSIDTSREIRFIESLETQAFGYPVDLDCVETLRMSEHYNESRVLVQGYGYHKGI